MGAINYSLDPNLVSKLKSALPLNILIETGTFKGDTVYKFKNFFDKIISIELSETLWAQAQKRFKNFSHIQILNGRSDEHLKKSKKNFKHKSILFWLDAHWCDDEGTAGEISQCPLINELNAIGKLNNDSVILIDDARLFLAPPLAPHDISQWPTFDQLLKLLKTLGPEHEIMIINDTLAFYPKKINEIMSDFAQENGTDLLIYSQELGEQIKDNKLKLRLINKLIGNAKILAKELNEKDKALRTITANAEEKEWLINNLNAKSSFLGIQTPWIIKRIGEIFAPRLGNLRQYVARPITNIEPEKKIPDNNLSFAIVTPSYEQGEFISRTIQSIIEQKYPFVEYFIQDGCSKDNTLNILKEYKNDFIKWESEEDNGQSQAINKGFKKINGDIMCWLNSDDILLPNALQTVSNYFFKNPNVDVLYGNRLQIDRNDMEIGRWILPGHNENILSIVDYIPQETLFWRRSMWEKIGGKVDESFAFAMDWELLIRFKDAGARFAHIPKFLGGFRIHEQQKTSAKIDYLGKVEMDKIRLKTLGRIPTNNQIRLKVFPYLLKHLWVDMVYRVETRLKIKNVKI
jgi:glycosyltransferase involved in cell wall biosynthesis